VQMEIDHQVVGRTTKSNANGIEVS